MENRGLTVFMEIPLGGGFMKKLLDHFEEYISALCIFIMTCIAFANVLSRKLLHASWSFTEEITTNLFILASMLGAAVAAKRGSHLGLSLFTDLLPKKYQKYVTLVVSLAAIALCVVIIVQGFIVVGQEMRSGQTTPALGWPEWIFGTFVPIGGIFIAIRYIQVAVNAFRKEKEGAK